MDRLEILELLRENASDMLDVVAEDIDEDTSFDDLGLDSLDRVQIAVMVEEEFGIELPDAESSDEIQSIGELIDYIEDSREE